MPRIQPTSDRPNGSAGISTTKVTTLQVRTASIEILIGGPYKAANGEMHNYGHAALRVVTLTEEAVFDFGRYGATKGLFGAEGEGVLRVWDKFDTYIVGENALSRTTTGFTYLITETKALEVLKHFAKLTAGGKPRAAKHPHQKEFQLANDYDAVTNNCATTTIIGAKLAIPDIDIDSKPYNQGRGMTEVEKTAARAHNFGWPAQIFMPADVQTMLENNKKVPAKKITIYKTGSR